MAKISRMTTDAPISDSSVTLDVTGMTCASCVAHVEKAVRQVPGVHDARVNLARGSAAVTFDPAQTDEQHIADAITRNGYAATPQSPATDIAEAEQRRLEHHHHEASGWLRRAVVGIILWLPLELTHWIMQFAGAHAGHAATAQYTAMGWAALVTSTLALLYVGGRFYSSAIAALRRGTSNMDTLISMGATVAYGYSLTFFAGGMLGAWPAPSLHDLYFMEATGLLALISLGHWLEARARHSAGSAIRKLLELTPSLALREKGSSFDEVPVAQLHVGDRVLVRPGDRVPVDGVVVDGTSNVDEAMITGEPIPVPRAAGDQVIGGTINQDGRLLVRVSKTGGQTVLSQIVSLVENAQSNKPPVQRLADSISAVFVPSVLVIALITGIGWYAWGHYAHWTSEHTWSTLARAVCSVLIIACPCALGLAVPATVMVGTGRGARRGILIRDIDALQQAEKIDTVVLDKTGTITRGKPVVVEIIAVGGVTADEVLTLAATAEQFSAHPLAKTVVAKARERGLKLSDPQGFNNVSGAGVVAQIAGKKVLVGNAALLREQGVIEAPPLPAVTAGATLIHVARDAAPLGTIVIADELKSDSIAAITSLAQMKLHAVLLTGDNRSAADAIARQIGIDDVHAEVRPADKAAVVQSLQRDSHRVAMVGDGINDAPALATADLGIAIGGGSDIAKEAGDIILVSGSLTGVSAAIRLSRATMRKIRQNLFLAFIYNVVAIPFAAMGLVNPIVAAAAMALSDVTVIGNALLLAREKIDVE